MRVPSSCRTDCNAEFSVDRQAAKDRWCSASLGDGLSFVIQITTITFVAFASKYQHHEVPSFDPPGDVRPPRGRKPGP